MTQMRQQTYSTMDWEEATQRFRVLVEFVGAGGQIAFTFPSVERMAPGTPQPPPVTTIEELTTVVDMMRESRDAYQQRHPRRM